MEDNKSNTLQSKIEDDIIFHFREIYVDLMRIKVDYNRDDAIVYKMDFLISKLILITDLYIQLDKPIFKALKIKVNKLISDNPELKGIIIHIENRRNKNTIGKIETFKISI